MIPSINNETTSTSIADELESRVADAGHRLPAPRQTVLRQIASLGPRFTATGLLEQVAEAAPDVGRATVFRTLDLLVQLRILQRVHTEAGGSRGHSYMLCGLAEEHHHHLVCNGCGTVTDLPGCFLDEATLHDIEGRTQFSVESHQLELYGTCGSCQEESR